MSLKTVQKLRCSSRFYLLHISNICVYYIIFGFHDNPSYLRRTILVFKTVVVNIIDVDVSNLSMVLFQWSLFFGWHQLDTLFHCMSYVTFIEITWNKMTQFNSIQFWRAVDLTLKVKNTLSAETITLITWVLSDRRMKIEGQKPTITSIMPFFFYLLTNTIG